MKKIKFLLVTLLLPISLSAQITFAEKKVEKPDWEYLRDVIMVPYDSLELTITAYPLFEAYKKYIGQQLFFVEGFNEQGHLRSENGAYLPNIPHAMDSLLHKYFEIVNVVPSSKTVLKYFKYNFEYGININYPKEDNPEKYESFSVSPDSIPIFVLKNLQTNEILYLDLVDYSSLFQKYNSPYRILLVGGFVKLKETAIGKNIVACHHSLGLDPEIISEWKCTDVSITGNEKYISECWGKGNCGSYERKSETISFVVQNSKDKNIDGYIELEKITEDFEKLAGHSCFMFEKTYKRYVSEHNKVKQKYNQQQAQEIAKRKQALTAKYGTANADKIMAGKFEIGMNKAVCKEIAGHATIINQTATTETWKISNIWTGRATYLYFTGDKLTRIVNR